MRIPFYMHDLGQEELDSVAQVFKGPILTTGETVTRFEEEFAKYLGCKYALGVTSCTGAMHLSLLALGIEPGDEVITTPMTFIATATAILEAGAKPVLVDVEPDTGNLNANLVEQAITERTRAILPVHLYGQMCDMLHLRKIADKHNLAIVEDAAHCIEGIRDGVRPGQLGDTACFSFYATKNLTCGEGGAVVANNEEIAKKLRLLSMHGMSKCAADRHKEGYKHWDMELFGWKYNMDNIQAAILLPQLKRLQKNWVKREILERRYREKLSRIGGISWPKTRPDTRHAHHLVTIWVEPEIRDSVIAGLQKAGISVMVNYRPIHTMTYFTKEYGFQSGDFPAAEKIGRSTITLPFYPLMKSQEVDHVVEMIANQIQAAIA